MSEVAVVALIVAKPGAEAKLLEQLEGIVGPTRSEEGALQYDLHRDLQEPRRFIFIERWASEAALAAHARSAHIDAYARRGGLDREFGNSRRVEGGVAKRAGRAPRGPGGYSGGQCDAFGTSRIRMIVQSASPS